MYKLIIVAILGLISLPNGKAQVIEKTRYSVLPFGEGGQIKMLYDRRQRPQSVYLNGKVHLAINAGGEKGEPGKSKSKPMAITFDLSKKEFSEAIVLGPAHRDHHFAPVIWSDNQDFLHILYGCHKTPGTHLISKKTADIGDGREDWSETSQIAPSISYPTFYQVAGNKELVYYRDEGHIGSWTYRVSDDNGTNWTGPENPVTDMDSKGRFQWSSYQTKLPSKDGRYLHVVFMTYDDNKQNDPARFYNKRYKKAVSNEWKYNLYYVKVDLETNQVYNFDGEQMDTPIDIDQANQKCLIWDTEGRGAGVPPDIVLDKDGNPAFLHVLSEETTEDHNYYFVRQTKGEWKKTVIAPSNHQWNSCHIQLDEDGVYHAYIVVGEHYIDTEWVEGKSAGDKFDKGNSKYLKTGGFMDKHGGGRVEEWVSSDNGNSWKKLQELKPDQAKYPGWKFNNIQPVTNSDGSLVEGMLLFYGWKDKDAPEAKAFLLVDSDLK
ncbi:MAG: BNR-4 repeat-containing protein [Cyclobacteriaceae bacterium]